MLGWMTDDFRARELDSPRFDAELILAHALEVERMQLYLEIDRPLSRDELSGIKALVKRRRDREPVAYIIEERGFYGRLFDVSPAVLIPRPDTETLVEVALGACDKEEAALLDLCTGSGVVPVTLACERPSWTALGTDVSEEALVIARANAARHEVTERVRFAAGDLFDAVPSDERYDVVTANPPYLSDAEFSQVEPELGFEPKIALVAPEDGYAIANAIIANGLSVLVPGGALLLEIGHTQSGRVADAMREAGYEDVATHRDLGKVERVVAGRAPS